MSKQTLTLSGSFLLIVVLVPFFLGFKVQKPEALIPSTGTTENNCTSTFALIVDSKHNRVYPKMTGINLFAGQEVMIIPHPESKWCGSGTKSGVFTDYKGYADRRDPDRNHGNWMQMQWQTNSSEQKVVVTHQWQKIESAGELQLYAADRRPEDNSGQIEVLVLVK